MFSDFCSRIPRVDIPSRRSIYDWDPQKRSKLWMESNLWLLALQRQPKLNCLDCHQNRKNFPLLSWWNACICFFDIRATSTCSSSNTSLFSGRIIFFDLHCVMREPVVPPRVASHRISCSPVKFLSKGIKCSQTHDLLACSWNHEKLLIDIDLIWKLNP